ncbi:MAG: CehA/McbA family metallohydrolase [Syntrophaceae bacterium]|nr:CehA/McbA family metallohydrolase [Syntrophaceae bacterium]
MEYFDYSGIIHFHSEYSFDGRIPLPEIIAAAKENGLDFLMLTDHSTLQASADGFGGWHDRVLLIVGQEVAPRFNHLLVFENGIPIEVDKDDTKIAPQSYIDKVVAAGGICFIAHPDHEGTALFHVKHYPWQDWNVSGYTGLGIWDFMTDWQNSLKGHLRAFLSYLWPGFFLQGPQVATLRRWDELNHHRRVVGIGESDNHATRKRIVGVTFTVFPFRKAFRFLRTHIVTRSPLTGDGFGDKTLLLDALRGGNVYIAQESFFSAKGFFLSVTEGKREATMGDIFFLDQRARLIVRVPANGHIRVVKDGSLYHEEIGRSASCFISQPGVYRIEVFAKSYGKYRPWIFSNPVYINR